MPQHTPAAPPQTPSRSDLARHVEERCLNAWPGLQQRLLDGSLLRFGEGFTRRANSVNAWRPGTLAAADRIARCEAAYRARALPCIFRITPLADPPELDALLAARGYRHEAETSVQLLHPLGDDPAHTRTDPACTLGGALEEAWQQPFTRMERMPPAHRQTFRRILAAIPVPHVAGRIDEGGATVCCGRAVAEDDLVGLFDLVTDPAQRGRGLARRLIAHLLAWGQAQGARGAYLQVEVQNAPALRLYDRLGFRELYRYWYRVGP